MKRLIITDSTADIPSNLATQLDIRVLPVSLYLDGAKYRDGIDMPVEKFWEDFFDYQDMSTGPISYEDYALLLLQVMNTYDEILIIHCSRHLSGTYDIAQRVRQEFVTHDAIPVKVIDSKFCGMGLGLIVIACARAFKEGLHMTEVAHLAEKMIDQIGCYLAIPTLTYLRKNRKISGLKAFIGSAMGVKPLLGFDNGRLVVKNRLIGENKNMVMAMLDQIREEIGPHPITLAISHARDRSLVRSLREVFESSFECREVFTTHFGPSIGISTGPETIGVAYHKHPG